MLQVSSVKRCGLACRGWLGFKPPERCPQSRFQHTGEVVFHIFFISPWVYWASTAQQQREQNIPCIEWYTRFVISHLNSRFQTIQVYYLKTSVRAQIFIFASSHCKNSIMFTKDIKVLAMGQTTLKPSKKENFCLARTEIHV